MKFGKEFRIHLEETLPEWRDKFLCYKPLKKLLKHLPPTVDQSLLPQDLQHRLDAVDGADHSEGGAPQLVDVQDWFVKILRDELEKFNDFYVDKEEEFIIRLQELKERIERAKEKSRNGVPRSENEFSEEMMDIRKDFVTIHGEMVLLKNYSSLNFAGLVKILKKYDKRTGGVLCLPFTQLAFHQPFFTTEPLTRLVHECEANLELLFPLEAEVVESPAISHQQATSSTDRDMTNFSPDTQSSLGEETVDIYRSTLAAIRTIKGLKKASSTYNPLSFASIFGNQDSESTGAVTAENSGSESLATSQNGEEATQDEDHSSKKSSSSS